MRSLRRHGQAQLADVVRVRPLGREASQLGLERHERLVQMMEGHVAAAQLVTELAEGGVLVAARDHQHARARPDDQARLLERPERLSDRRAADARLLRERDLGGEPLALAKVAGRDALAQQRGELLVGPRHPDRGDDTAVAIAASLLLPVRLMSRLTLTLHLEGVSPADAMAFEPGNKERSSSGLNGIGTAGVPSRRTGVRSSSNSSAATRAAISAPAPKSWTASWTTSRRPVRRTDSSTVSMSSGTSERRSITSSEDGPSSAAARHSRSLCPRSRPSRPRRARDARACRAGADPRRARRACRTGAGSR